MTTRGGLASRVAVVAHADWSVDRTKRCIAIASRSNGAFVVEAAKPVGAIDELLPALHDKARGGAVLAGFDFPIGLPRAYAKKAGVRRFDAFLRKVGQRQWSSFYDLAREKTHISVHRPFYPHGTGGKAQAHLVGALGVTSMNDLLRDCDRKTSTRNAACALFWTLGPKQVGRAAISGWQQLIAPALAARRPRTALWPFHGPLADLVESHDCVIAETYPAEAYLHVGLPRAGAGWSKREHADRRRHAKVFESWAAEHGIGMTPPLRRQIADGFGSAANGEDYFDAVAGVLSMLSVVLGIRRDGAPDTPIVRDIEGWILGQDCEALA